MQKEEKPKEIQIYRGASGEVFFDVDAEAGTIWATREQISRLFSVDKTVISRHIRNIFRDGELEESRVSAKNALTAADGKTYQTNFYNLDVIISVGYRVNSKKATDFRIWATNVLRKYLTKGVVVNENSISRLDKKKLREIEGTLKLVKRMMNKNQLSDGEANGILEVISKYEASFEALSEYDSGHISFLSKKKPGKVLSVQYAEKIIEQLKNKINGGELFGKVRNGSFEGCLASIYQTFDNNELYKTISEKAANLLYLLIKDHPFYDGNKRIGALLFIVFLTINDFHLSENGETKISDRALTAIALLIAESEPSEKELIIGIICKMLEEK